MRLQCFLGSHVSEGARNRLDRLLLTCNIVWDARTVWTHGLSSYGARVLATGRMAGYYIYIYIYVYVHILLLVDRGLLSSRWVALVYRLRSNEQAAKCSNCCQHIFSSRHCSEVRKHKAKGYGAPTRCCADRVHLGMKKQTACSGEKVRPLLPSQGDRWGGESPRDPTSVKESQPCACERHIT